MAGKLVFHVTSGLMRDRKCRMARKVANNLNITLYLGQNQHL